MQTPISLRLYFFLNFLFMILQNMIICTVGVHYPYLAKFAGCNKINILKRLFTRFTYLRSYLKVRKWFQPCFTPENYHYQSQSILLLFSSMCWYKVVVGRCQKKIRRIAMIIVIGLKMHKVSLSNKFRTK